MNKILLFASLFVFAIGCKNNKAAEEAAMKATADSLAAVEAAKKLEDSLAAAAAALEAADTLMWASELGSKLRSQLVANPLNQNDLDKNIILKYAAKNNWNIKFTPSGLAYVEEKAGKGAAVKPGIPFSMHYKGYFLDGKEFDSSYKAGQPYTTQIGQVIEAWNEASQMMKPGGKMKILSPSVLAYGPQGFPGAIPPNSVLAFDLELVSVGK
jgi:FKBP-type peptidyl-prolyl cis-trans isomerase FkpA